MSADPPRAAFEQPDQAAPGRHGELERTASNTLPVLHEAVLDEAGLAALATDLGALCVLHEVRVKRAAAQRADAAPLALPEALARLRAGEVAAVQVRYGYQGRTWIDTLLRTPAGVRLLRVEAPA